ncbi:MAG TPA: guanitoxin biosynthesis MBL fold metallo-hydrolase GntH [Thermodesulfobacteriota bacterium]|nr:guanitoxin biosynthesis MBL fold metallo-hydrolase GntH [Thermodesulfobacteriota bacterium]
MMKNLTLIALALLVFLCMFLAQSCTSKTKPAAEINELSKLAYEGGTLPLTAAPVVGTPNRKYNSNFKPGAEPLDPDEIRVTILGSGDPFVKRGQASASVLIEVGNERHDFFFFDLGSGALANFDGLQLPVAATTKVFLTHLHADHMGELPTLLGSLAKSGRRDPVEVWGPAGETKELGTLAFAQHLDAAMAWDYLSMNGHPGQSGSRLIPTEVPYDKPATVYERNGVKISSFPVIHILNGAVGYRLDYKGSSVVFTGDTRPSKTTLEACKGGVDLLIHETFPSAAVFAKKASVTEEQANKVVNESHTSPAMAGKVFKRAGARMSVMWHLVVDHDTVGPAYQEMRSQYDGPVTIAQDLTVFNITRNAVVVRQAIIDPVAWPVIGKANVSGPPLSKPPNPPEWWAAALITD